MLTATMIRRNRLYVITTLPAKPNLIKEFLVGFMEGLAIAVTVLAAQAAVVFVVRTAVRIFTGF